MVEFSSTEQEGFSQRARLTKKASMVDRNPRKPGRPQKYRTLAERRRAAVRKQQRYRQRRKRSVHFRSDTDLWSTPQALFDTLHAEFSFTCDVCADASNAKCARYFTPEADGLRQRWEGVCWMNPPYGSEIGLWVQKAFESSLWGTTVVCLLPARVDTKWWRQYVTMGNITYLPGRVKFVGQKNSAPFPSALVVFRPR